MSIPGAALATLRTAAKLPAPCYALALNASGRFCCPVPCRALTPSARDINLHILLTSSEQALHISSVSYLSQQLHRAAGCHSRYLALRRGGAVFGRVRSRVQHQGADLATRQRSILG